MDITYLGQSAFKLKTKNALLVTDPFDPEMVGLKFPKIEGVEIVTVSHQHEDHNYLGNIKEVRMVIDGPGEYEVAGISVQGISTYHDAKKGEDRGLNTVYVYEAEGIRLAHLGDLGHKLTESDIEEIGTIDILMIPVGGFYTINAELASEIIRDIEPSIILPMHYRLEGMKNELAEKLSPLEDFLKACGMSVEKMDKLAIKKTDILETESKVISLSLQK